MIRNSTEASPDHAADMVQIALRLRRYLDRRNAAHTRTWDCHIGIATGPVTGSIVGIQNKFMIFSVLA